jgi:hypothetical protein
MVFEYPYPAFILDRNNRGNCSACPSGTLAFSTDISRVYSVEHSGCCLGMAWKNVALYFSKTSFSRGVLIAKAIPKNRKRLDA